MTEESAARDREIIERIRSGDSAAFDELVGHYATKAYQTALGLLGNHLDAEEVVQDAFVKVHKNLEKFRGDSSFSTWLYRIVTNLSRNRYHWNRRRGAGVNVSISDRGQYNNELSDMEISDDRLEPDLLLERMELETTLLDALKTLPEKLREVIVLRHMEEISYQEMADLLGCELGTVKSRLARARKALKMKFIQNPG